MKTNRLILMAAALLGLPLAACEEGTKPPAMGDIEGQVVIEGEGIDGVSVSLSSGATTTTSGGGYYSFTEVEAGTYTITITGLPADASFDATTAEVTIASADQRVSRNFNGSWIRTASLMGMVTVEGTGLPGITVSISGRQEAQMVTDANGQYTFTGLRAGNYTVEISGFDATDVGFSATSSAVEVAVGESKVWSFDGTYVRESAISGQVSVEGNGLAGVTVSLQGMGADDDQNTDMGGQFTFSNLRAGEYQLAISGYDTDEYGFSTTSATVRVEHGRTANVPFEGILLRTAAIMGQVSIEGEGLAGVTVSLSGEGENQTARTDNSGQYAFSDLPAGNFQVGISGYDTDDYSFETTSKNVALALGETATVPFEGTLLRTSGISGRVSVEGHGLDSVMVTLSGDALDADMTAMTDASGQYAFAGLAEGDYTVAISGFDAVAYVFGTTSMDVTLGDDDTQIVNFTGEHARTASVSGMLYVDEAGKNDSFDEGEDALAVPGIALVLVGPGILDRAVGATGPDGSFAFSNLRSGNYQLVVASPNPAVPADYAYGGGAAGYEIALDVGEAATQNIPFDITHTTVNFSVSLKHGDGTGDALPGATVTVYKDLAGTLKIDDADTGADGTASIRIARNDVTGNTVYAIFAPPDESSYHTSGGFQAVTWDPKNAAASASNDADIVNLMTSFSFDGATVQTDFGGGEALGGWKVSVTSGDDAVDGAPTKLDANGSASFSESVAAGDLPKTYRIAMAGWKDQSNDATSGDGGERYTSTALEHTHDGLSLAGTAVEAGTLQVTYTTQKLKVYVHNERDQVMGYTGNVLGGDERMSGVLDVELRHIERSSGRSRAFQSTDSIRSSSKDGVYTFSNVPANAQVIVHASVKSGQNVKLLGEDELDAYTDNADNGRMGGAFGDNGGYSHTVELCPLMSRGSQRHSDECGTFAFVNTYHVHGQVWEYTVATDGGAGGFKAAAKTAYKGVVVSMDPVDGENLAGDSDSYTSGTDNKATRNFNEAMFFDWERKAAGEYKLNVSGGWVARVGTPDANAAFGNELSPLGADLQIDVSPTTGYVYGTVTDSKGFRVDSATVSANGATATTDAYGRYRIRGFSGATVNRVANRVAMTVTKAGFKQGKRTIAFAANDPGDAQDFELSGEAKTATVSGTVRSGGNPVAGVTISVNGGRPLGATKDLKTGANGTYTALVPVGNVTIAPAKAGMSFFPESHTVTTTEGGAVSGLDFTGYAHGTITGRVLSTSGGPMSGVKVTATPAAGGAVADSSRTDVRGVYSLSVPFGRYMVAAEAEGYTFATEDDDASVSVNVAAGGTASVEDFHATAKPRTLSSDATLSALSLGDDVDLVEDFAADDTVYTAEAANNVGSVTVTGTATHDSASVSITLAGDEDDEDADQSNGRSVDLEVGNTAITAMVVSEDDSDTTRYHVTVTRKHAVVTLASSQDPVGEGEEATITATLDYAQDRMFTVTVGAKGGSFATGANKTLTFEEGTTASTGTVTVTAANDTIRNAEAQTVKVWGTTAYDDVTSPTDTVEIAVTDDEIAASAPRNLKVERTDGGSDGDVTLTWERPSNIGTWPITGYEAQATAPQRTPVTGTVTDLSAAFTGLALGVEYTFTVNATTEGGDGKEASKTGKALPTITMTVTGGPIVEAGTDTVTVALSLPASGENIAVTVAVPDSSAALVKIIGGSMTIEAGATVDTARIVAVQNRVDADNSFIVTATADNAHDPDPSAAITITDDDEAPQVAPVLTVGSPGSGSLLLTWTFDATGTNWGDGRESTRKFQYRIKTTTDVTATPFDDDDWKDVPGSDGDTRSYRVTGLEAEEYTVEVRARTEAGGSTASNAGTGTPGS